MTLSLFTCLSPAAYGSRGAAAAKAPLAPVNVRASAGDGSAQVSWTPARKADAAGATYSVSARPGGPTRTTKATVINFRGLRNGKQYTFIVRATNPSGTSKASAPSKKVAPMAAEAPGRPFITDLLPRDSSVRIDWSPPATGADSITKYVLTASPGGATMEVPGDVTEADFTGLTNGTDYTFTVAAANAIGTGDPSAASDPAQPRPAEVPLAPAVDHAFAGNGKVDVQWAAPPDGGAAITGYQVTAQPGDHTMDIPAGTTVATLGSLDNGTTYSVTVTAQNSAGTSAASEAIKSTPQAGRPPGQPGGLRAWANASGSLTVAWSPPADTGTSPVTSYTLTTSPGGKSVTTSGTQAAITGLDPDTGYTATVTATNGEGAGTPSTPVGPVAPQLTVKKAPKILSDAALATIQDVHPDGTLDFTNPPAEVTALATDDLIVVNRAAHVPDPMLRRVTELTTYGDLVTVQTAAAKLSDAYTDASFGIESALTSSDLLDATRLAPGVTFSRPTRKNKSIVGPGYRTVTPYGIGVSNGALDINIDKQIGDDNGPGGRIAASVKVTPHISMKNVKANSGIVDGTFSATADYSSNIRLDAGFFLKKEKEFDLPKFKIACPAAGPFVFCVELQPVIKIEAGGSVGITFSATYGRTIGVSFARSGGNTTASIINNSAPTGNGLSVTPYGSVSLKLSVPLRLSIELYGELGPGLSLAPYIEGTADTSANPWWTLKAGLNMGVFFDAFGDWGGKTWEDPDFFVDASITLASASGPFTGITITPATAQVGVGARVDHTVNFTNVPSTDVTWRIVSGPGQLDQTGTYTATANGKAVIEATSTGAGGIYTSRAGIAVGEGLPSEPRNVVALGAPLGAQVSWDAPADPGANPITGYVVTASPENEDVSSGRSTYVGADTHTASLTSLFPGIIYDVRVYAETAYGTGSPSTAVQVVPEDSPIHVGSAKDLAVDAQGNPDDTGTAGLYGSAISGNGRYILFHTQAGSNLAPPSIYQPGSTTDYLLRKDLDTGEIVVASYALDGTTPNPSLVEYGDSRPDYSLNYDGSVVAYEVPAQNPTPARSYYLYVHDFTTNKTYNPDASIGSETFAHRIILSDDGKTVGFASQDPESRDFMTAIYKSPVDGSPTRIDKCPYSGCALNVSYDMSRDGNVFAYTVDSKGLSAPDDCQTVLVYDSGSGQTSEPLPDCTGTLLTLSAPALSGDGNYLSATTEWWSDDANGFVFAPVRFAWRSTSPSTGNAVGVGTASGPYALDGDGNALLASTVNFRTAVFQGNKGTVLPDPAGTLDYGICNITTDGTRIVWTRAKTSGSTMLPLPGVWGVAIS